MARHCFNLLLHGTISRSGAHSLTAFEGALIRGMYERWLGASTGR
jgi:hypothetical protein